MDYNVLLLKKIRQRAISAKSPFNEGILVASRYVDELENCVGHDLCYRYGSKGNVSFNDAQKRAASTLTYNNPEMVVQDVYADAKTGFEAEYEIELPKNTLMVFKHVLTTPRKDRDGDILRTEGAKPDPKMLLLWQHVHTLPIGKALKVLKHTSKTLEMLSAIIDINELAHDAAVMIDNKMGRFSHGFRALSFCDMKEEVGSSTGSNGFDVKEFEIMEESLVSVPSNVDAEQQELLLDLIEGDKLSSSMMKSFGKKLRSGQTKTMSSGGFVEKEDGEQSKDKSGPGCGCKGSEKSDGAGKPPEETNADPAEGSEDTEDKKGLNCPKCEATLSDGVCPDCDYKPSEEGKSTAPKNKAGKPEEKAYYGSLPGSWEDIQDSLRGSCRAFLISKGLVKEYKPGSDEYSYCYLMSTSESKGVIALEASGNDRKYYQVPWSKNVAGVAEWEGDPKEVEIRISANVIEKAKRASGIDLKSGRALSKSTLEKMKEVESDLEEIHEHCSTRSGKALCKKAAGTVKTLITQAEAAKPPEGELKPTPGGEGLLSMQAAAEFLAKSTPSERNHVLGVLKAQCTIDDQENLTKSFRRILKEVPVGV